MKYAFYVSHNATRLKKFLGLYANHNILKKIEFVLIDNDKNTELRDLCGENSIKYIEYNLEQFDKKIRNQVISDMFLSLLEKYKIDYAFIFADRILIGNILYKFKNRLINFHPSLLPSYKGLHAIDQALNDNAFLLGNSAHIVTNELDGGLVVMQNIVPSYFFSDYDDVLDKQLPMLLQIMLWIDAGRLIVNENSITIAGASYDVEEFIPNMEIDI